MKSRTLNPESLKKAFELRNSKIILSLNGKTNIKDNTAIDKVEETLGSAEKAEVELVIERVIVSPTNSIENIPIFKGNLFLITDK